MVLWTPRARPGVSVPVNGIPDAHDEYWKGTLVISHSVAAPGECRSEKARQAAENVQKADQHFRYEHVDDDQLQQCMRDRHLALPTGRAPTKRNVTRFLKYADKKPSFHRILDLPPESKLRDIIYDYYLTTFWDHPLYMPTNPPLTRTCRMLRNEVLPVFYRECLFDLRLMNRSGSRGLAFTAESMLFIGTSNFFGINRFCLTLPTGGPLGACPDYTLQRHMIPASVTLHNGPPAPSLGPTQSTQLPLNLGSSGFPMNVMGTGPPDMSINLNPPRAALVACYVDLEKEGVSCRLEAMGTRQPVADAHLGQIAELGRVVTQVGQAMERMKTRDGAGKVKLSYTDLCTLREAFASGWAGDTT